VVDKPAGPTSFDVVNRVRRCLGIKSAGHLGTLDPMATGLLVVATGAATRCVPVWQGGEKTYEAIVLFGVTTDTQDVTGTVLERREVALEESAVREASRSFLGSIEQVPPMVSALKVGGERLYRMARRGITIDRASRPVEIREWEWLGFDSPEARFRVRCSSGTYVRTLAHDLGAVLGTGATLKALRRLRSEPFGLERSVTLEDLGTLAPDAVFERAGIPLAAALARLPRVELDEAAADAIGHGRSVEADRGRARLDPGAAMPTGPRSVALFGPRGDVLALGEIVEDAGAGARIRVRPHVVFPWAVREGKP
jgi:tRNA pseudouridine55 synthase